MQAWNKELDLTELESLVESAAGNKTFDVCTVRSNDLDSMTAGTAYWLLVAQKLAQAGNQVNVYDFPDGKTGDHSPATKFLEIIGQPNTLRVYQAEKLEGIENTLDSLEQLAGTGINLEGIHSSVGKQLKKLQSDDTQIRAAGRSDLYRIAEELNVFLQGREDEDRVQLSAHEIGTVNLVQHVRNLPKYQEDKKEYWRVDLGFGEGSEFRRGRIATLKDIHKRLLLGNNQEPSYRVFHLEVVERLVQAINSVEIPHQKIIEAVEECAKYDPMVKFSQHSYQLALEWNRKNLTDRTVIEKVEMLPEDLRPSIGVYLSKEGYSTDYLGNIAAQQIRQGLRAMRNGELKDPTWLLELLLTHDQQGHENQLSIGEQYNLVEISASHLTPEHIIKTAQRFYDKGPRFGAILYQAYLNTNEPTHRETAMVGIKRYEHYQKNREYANRTRQKNNSIERIEIEKEEQSLGTAGFAGHVETQIDEPYGDKWDQEFGD